MFVMIRVYLISLSHHHNVYVLNRSPARTHHLPSTSIPEATQEENSTAQTRRRRGPDELNACRSTQQALLELFPCNFPLFSNFPVVASFVL